MSLILCAACHQTLDTGHCDRCHVALQYTLDCIAEGEAHRKVCPGYGCSYGDPCRLSSSGGSCPDCNYPRALAHPDDILLAFFVDAIWIGGTAIRVCPDLQQERGTVAIVDSAGNIARYLIPREQEELGTIKRGTAELVLYGGLTAEQCLDRYTQLQRDVIAVKRLDDAQLAAARALWSDRIRAHRGRD